MRALPQERNVHVSTHAAWMVASQKHAKAAVGNLGRLGRGQFEPTCPIELERKFNRNGTTGLKLASSGSPELAQAALFFNAVVIGGPKAARVG